MPGFLHQTPQENERPKVVAVFDYYTMKQLAELRSMCADGIERVENVQDRADTLLLIEHIDEELVLRDGKQAA
jgi:hypothetical protein